MTELVDQYGRPLRREVLTQEIAGPTLAGLRSPIAGYPADGLNPMRLAQILRGADMGDPQRYFELAELIEERDLHYVGVLGKRKRSVAQVDVTVISASDDPRDVAMADMVREWLDRDELEDEKFDILDAIGKGDSFTEIVWDTSEGQWRPARLEWRDPRWFEYDRRDGRTPLLRGGESGVSQSIPLEPFKFIRHTVKAKSGLPVRSGIARIAAWAWMFKAFTQRDWAIFTQTYGQPVRLGKFASSASDTDRNTLYRAVANIAGDMAAIIPEGMSIEFIESKNVGAGSELYERRADWLDSQISKAVLGQTGTTDSKKGGLGDSGNKVHQAVEQNIEKADCKGLAATLNRDLIRPWIDLEYGPQQRYPRIKIERPEAEDLKLLADVLDILVPLGMRVSAGEVRDKIGLADPAPDDQLLVAPPSKALPVIAPSLQSQQPVAVVKPSTAPADQIADRMVQETAGGIQGWLAKLGEMMGAATSLPELREMVANAYPTLDTAPVAAKLADGFVAAQAAGISDVEDTGA
ncbi:DUF935 domain-containing protein [Sphingomonas sp. CROZ-RG-20F-R02-07]|uniref:DUF935 domain-containing protein n=1 Tax=Sphingomonas sp. CROZ-RG-20F-R02-07 TaxID=2914832 RepID=UPI001F566EF4|nr:DUF935 domain-containing protein [Sphingomonas sp. CROZ-RG-20F-R02-07]